MNPPNVVLIRCFPGAFLQITFDTSLKASNWASVTFQNVTEQSGGLLPSSIHQRENLTGFCIFKT